VVELYTEARRVLDAARDARTPSREDRERVFASLMATIAVGAVAPSIVVGAVVPSIAVAKSGFVGKVASGALWVKAAASVAVLSVASASTFVYVRHHAHARPATPARVVTPAAARPAAPLAPVAEPAALPVLPIPSAVAPRGAKALPVERSAPAPRRKAVDEPSAEVGLLREAREARRAGQPERALELAHQQAQQYPRSQLWAERETLRVLALCDLGRIEAARRTAAPLQYLWSSPLQATLNASCVGK
jgi:hypothetical protein